MKKYSEAFSKAMEFLFLSEGGTNNDPDDNGGLTVFGISQNQYHDIDLLKLTKKDALRIYYQDYWLKNRCESMREDLAIVMFDSAVNCGSSSAARWLQKACNAKNSQLVVDGMIGPITLIAIESQPALPLIMHILAYRLQRYARLIKQRPKQKKFIRGWINRVAKLIFFIN